MKKQAALLSMIMTLAVSSALAAPEPNQPLTPVHGRMANIYAGNLNIGGFFDLRKYSGRRNDHTEYEASFLGRYFVLDRVALGLNFGLDATSDGDTVSTLGPSGYYYFWNDGKLAAFTGLGFRFGLTNPSISSVTSGALGMEYFITPTVAFGPNLFFNHYNSRSKDYERYGMAINFGIYL